MSECHGRITELSFFQLSKLAGQNTTAPSPKQYPTPRSWQGWMSGNLSLCYWRNKRY